MHLPDYFMADLPPEATLSPTMIREACQTLKRNRERYLAKRSTQSLISLLSNVARSWLEPGDEFRKLALDNGPKATGFSRQTLASGLDAFFSQLTREKLQALLEQDLGHPQRIEQLSASMPEQKFDRAAIATGPELLVQITAGNLPIPALSSMVLGVLARSAQFLKCPARASLLPRLFAHSLYLADRQLGACLEVAHWPGGSDELENVLFEEAECVTATGSDETLKAIRRRLPPSTRFLAYGHRVSFGFIASGSLSGLRARRVVEGAAADVVAWNQLGCLSPHLFYVESGGAVSPEQFAHLLAGELARREASEPRGELPVELAAAIASRRSLYELRAAHSPDTRFWFSPDSTAWTVVYEADARFQASCLHRFVYVKSVRDLTDALQNADSIRSKVSTVGLAASEDQAQRLATELARWGATRVCPIGQMQNPPLTWRHDGRPALADLMRWTDWETRPEAAGQE